MPNRKSSDTAQDTDIIRKPTHNDNPKVLAAFLRELEVWLLLQDDQYRTLLEQRTVMYRSQVCVVNATHARQINNRTFPTEHGLWADRRRGWVRVWIVLVYTG